MNSESHLEQESPSKWQRIDGSTMSIVVRQHCQEIGVSSFWPHRPDLKLYRQIIRHKNTCFAFGGSHKSGKEAVEQRIELLRTLCDEDAGSWQNVLLFEVPDLYVMAAVSSNSMLAYQLVIEKVNTWTRHDCKEVCKHLIWLISKFAFALHPFLTKPCLLQW